MIHIPIRCTACGYQGSARKYAETRIKPLKCRRCHSEKDVVYATTGETSTGIALVLKQKPSEFQIWYDDWLTRMMQTSKNRYKLELYENPVH